MGFVKASKAVSVAQAERQKTRKSGGRYAKMNACELCGKGCGADFCTIEWMGEKDWPGYLGVTLHEDCCLRLQAMGKEVARATLASK